MAFEKDDPRINRSGRPKGSRNKVKAQRDISNAIAEGKSLQDMVDWLSGRLDDDKISETQKGKYAQELIKLKLELAKIEFKSFEVDNPKEKVSKDKPKGDVRQFPKAVFQSKSN